MATLIHHPSRDCVSPLGIPVDNLTLTEAVDKVTAMARRREGRARLVSTLNVDFLVNALGTRFADARHPELLDVLRNSDLVTADGFPLLWLSRLLGRPLQQRVCGSDLVPALAERAAEEGLSIFLLGGGDGAADAAAYALVQRFPKLRIAGTAAPVVHIEGPGLADAARSDRELVENINRSGADILLIGFGNPKQELWFNRNRDRLEVPVSIGVGGTFEFIAGNVRRAPRWVQRLNLEWAYRIAQDPARLWRRYLRGAVRLVGLSLPLLLGRLSEKLAFARETPASPDTLRWRRLWSSRNDSLSVLRMPRYVSRPYLEAVAEHLVSLKPDTGVYLVDFSRVRRVEMAGHRLLLTLAELQRQSGGAIQLLAIPARLHRNLAATRVLDALEAGERDTLGALSADERASLPGLSCRSYVLDDCAVIFLGGRVTRDELLSHGVMECIEHNARGRDCVLDLRNVTLLENSAVTALAPFFAGGTKESGRIIFSGITPAILPMIQVAGLGGPQDTVNDSMLLDIISESGFCDDA